LKIDITGKISGLIIIVVLVTGISSSLLFSDYLRRDEMRHIERNVKDIAMLSVSHFSDNMQKGELREISEHLKTIITLSGNISKVRIYNGEGALLSGMGDLTRRSTDDKWITDAINSKSAAQKWDNNRFRHFEPIISGKKITGFLYLEYNTSFLPDFIAKRRISFISTAGVLTLLLILMGISLSRRFFAKPLIEIADASKKVAGGDFSVSVPVRSNDEFGLLAENFNRMVERLDHVNTELSNYSKNLEYVIGLRTERLNSTLKELQHQKDFTDRLISTAGALIIVLDEKGRIEIFNRKCEEVTGFSEDEVKGRPIWEFLIPEKDKLKARMVFDELVRYRLPNSAENHLLTKKGREITILWNNTVIVDDNNELEWIIGTGVDLTEKKNLERQLQESQKLQAIGTLSAGLSHNLNNMLVGVMGYSGLVRMKLAEIKNPAVEEVLGYVDIIENSTKKASDLIKQLRTFSTKATYERTEINLNDAINDVMQAITATFPKSVKIETAFNPDLWNVIADNNQIQQVILNMCLNSKEAMSDGGTFKIETCNEDIRQSGDLSLRQGRYAAIRISDTGHGMDEETKQRIFEPFFTTKGLLDHTGLGLSIAYSIIRHHNGYIRVDSAPGQPTIFTIYLPAA